MSEYMTVEEAAKHLKVSKPTIFRWMRTGRLSFYKLGHSTRFKREQLDLVARKVTGEVEAEAVKKQSWVCGNTDFVEGRLRSTGRVYFTPHETKFLVLADSHVDTEAMACTACGHMELFSDPDKLNRLVPDKG